MKGKKSMCPISNKFLHPPTISFGNGVQKPIKQSSESAKQNEGEGQKEGDVLLVGENGSTPLSTKIKADLDKTANAFTVYPAKGLRGSRNANFYEFLSMGTVPYIIGSLTLMGVFAGVAPFFAEAKDKLVAKRLGASFALGVLLYGVGKSLAPNLLKLPFKMKYGVDPDMTYRKEINELPEGSNTDGLKKYEYHKAFESVDFPRWDLLYDNKKFGDNYASWYDKTAKKMGYGENLPASDQAVKPALKEKLVKLKTYSTIISYLWAITGVAYAAQSSWGNVQLPRIGDFKESSKQFLTTFKDAVVDAAKNLVHGKNNKLAGYGGKALLGLTLAATIWGNIAVLNDGKITAAKKAAQKVNLNDSDSKAVC